MKIEIPYAQETRSFTLPEDALLGVYNPNHVEIKDEAQTIAQALANPHGGMTFEAFLQDARDIMFLVNDGTRPTPTGAVLERIYDQIKDRDVHFMVATGCHRAPTEDENRMILGPTYEAFKDRLIVHDAYKSEMVHLGVSQQGTEMDVNKRVYEADRLVVIGSVEPHYFAGYTGGRKAFLPGVAAYKTIEQNHKYALRPEAHALALKGNPVHEDMEDALANLQRDKVFSIQTVLDSERRIYGATAGDIHDSFYAAIDMAHDVFCVKIPQRADVVVSVAPYPMDVNLYQSQKAIENAKLAVKPGGIIILVSACRKGIGEDTFYKLLASHDEPQDVLDAIEGGYKLGYHKAAKIVEAAIQGSVWLVSDLEDKLAHDVFMTPQPSIQSAVDNALAQQGPNAKLLVLPEGSITVPMLSHTH